MRPAGGVSAGAKAATAALLAVAAVTVLAALLPGTRPVPIANRPTARLDTIAGSSGRGSSGRLGDGRPDHRRGSPADTHPGRGRSFWRGQATTSAGSPPSAPLTSSGRTGSGTAAGAAAPASPAPVTAASPPPPAIGSAAVPGPCQPWQLQVITTTSAPSYSPGEEVWATSVVTQVAGPACRFVLEPAADVPCGVQLSFDDPTGRSQYWPWPGEQVPCPASGPMVLAPGGSASASQAWTQQAMASDGQPVAVPAGSYAATGEWAWDDGSGAPAVLAARSAPFTIG